jgi:alpha-methylacyl-CoA racemase
MAMLRGTRVLDLSRMLPAGALTQLLADLGAEVLKVERPGTGDETRAYGWRVAGTSATHSFQDRGKLSLALDLKEEAGIEIVRRLAVDADIFIESFRPGVAERLGLGYEDLRALNPRLVYCSVNGYGTGGPREQAPGHDVNYLAYAGAVGFGGTRDGGPALAGIQSADLIGGLLAGVGLLAALASVRAGAEGEHIEVALADASLWAMGVHVSSYLAGSPASGPESSLVTGASPAYRTYRCADGRYLSVGAIEPQFWAELTDALNRPDLLSRQHDPSTARELEELFQTRPLRDWLELLEGRDTCVAPVQTFQELRSDPQFAARRMFVPVPGEEDLVQVGNPIKTRSPLPEPTPAAPESGRDTIRVLERLGLPDELIRRASRWMTKIVQN